jgi:hypothetical protein
MFDDLVDPDPPRPGLDTLAAVSERARRLRRRREATRVMSLGAVAGLLVGSLAFVVDGDPDQQSEIAESLDAGENAVTDLDELVNPTESTATVVSEPVPAITSPATESSAPTTDATPVGPPTTAVPLPLEPVPYLAVGDSVMLGAAPVLAERGLTVDAAVSRQMIDMIPFFEQLRDQHLFGTAVGGALGDERAHQSGDS